MIESWQDWKPKSESKSKSPVDTPSQDLVPSSPRPDGVTQLGIIKSLVLDSVVSKHSRRSYDKSLTDFLAWYAAESPGQGFTKATVQRYARRLAEEGKAASTQNVRLTAVRRLAAEAADNNLLAPELAAGISRVK